MTPALESTQNNILSQRRVMAREISAGRTPISGSERIGNRHHRSGSTVVIQFPSGVQGDSSDGDDTRSRTSAAMKIEPVTTIKSSHPASERASVHASFGPAAG